jgi:hypothetical protein
MWGFKGFSSKNDNSGIPKSKNNSPPDSKVQPGLEIGKWKLN